MSVSLFLSGCHTAANIQAKFRYISNRFARRALWMSMWSEPCSSPIQLNKIYIVFSQAVTHPGTNTARRCLTSASLGFQSFLIYHYYFMLVVWMAEGGQARVKIIDNQGIARTQSPTNKNYALELPTFGAIVGVSQTEVQWNGLILEEPPSWSRFTSVPGKYAVWRRQTELSLSDLESLLWSIWKSSANYVQRKRMNFKKLWVWLF